MKKSSGLTNYFFKKSEKKLSSTANIWLSIISKIYTNYFYLIFFIHVCGMNQCLVNCH